MKSAARKPDLAPLRLFLRIKHPHIDPKAISDALELTPEHSIAAGPSVSAQGTKKLHSETYWLAELHVPSVQDLIGWNAPPTTSLFSDGTKPSNLPGMMRGARLAGLYDLRLLFWIKQLDKHSTFLREVVNGGGMVVLVVQRANREAPMNVSPAVMRRLAELEIGLEID